MTSPWPFIVWDIDIIGEVRPKASNGHHYIVVAIERNIICRYGLPHHVVTDNGVQFRVEMAALLGEYKIEHHRSSPYRPQANGAVEAANKNVKKILSKMLKNNRDWSEYLQFAL